MSQTSYLDDFDVTIKKEAELGDLNTLDETILSAVFASGMDASPYLDHVTTRRPLRSMWFQFFMAAQNFEMDNPKQDVLLRQILYIRECGEDSASMPGSETVSPNKVSTFPNGQAIWKGLPYLAEEFYTFWFEQEHGMSIDQKISISAFLARLASVGVCKNEFTGFALLSFRNLLEYPIEGVDSPNGSANSQAEVQELLKILIVWLKLAGHKLFYLTNAVFCDIESMGDSYNHLLPGSLADVAGVPKISGFNQKRWSFWKARLKFLAEVHSFEEAPSKCKLTINARETLQLLCLYDQDSI